MPLRAPCLAAALAAALPAAALAQAPFAELALADTTLTAPDTWVDTAAPADVDGDGDLDLLTVGTVRSATALTLYRNDGPAGPDGWAFTPVAVPLPADAAGFRADVAWGDYDDDGDPDAVVGLSDSVGAGLGAMALYRNDAGTLVLTPTALLRYGEDTDVEMLDHRSLTWADADNDGDLDLLIPSARPPAGFGTLPTTLLRNDGPGTGAAWRFVRDAELPQTYNAVTAWGDADGDGDLDLLLAEFARSLSFTRTYRNDGGALVAAGAALPALWQGTADWGDADGDGDLDVLMAGLFYEDGDFTDDAVRVYFDAGSAYDTLTVVRTGGPENWVRFTAASWADYDSDGDVDLLVAGQAVQDGAFVGRSLVYANAGGAFALAAALPAPNNAGGQNGGSFVWFDVDGDGDLDFFVTGGYEIAGPSGNEFEARAQLFRNDAPQLNAPPAAPSDLAAAPEADRVTLSWAPASDDHTPTDALTYNLWVRAGPGSDIVSPMAVPSGAGTRLLPEAGNVSHATAWTLRDLPPGTYAWTVQAIDNAFNGGPFAAEGTFTVGPVTAEPGAPAADGALRGVAPNPAAGAATLAFDLAAPAEVGATLYDALGRAVRAVPPRPVEAGPGRTLPVDLRGLPAGAYLVRLEVRRGDATTRSAARLTVVR